MDKNKAEIRFNTIKNEILHSYPSLKKVKIYDQNKDKNDSRPNIAMNKNKIKIILPILNRLYNNNKTNEVKEFDFVESIISLCHEYYHALQLQNKTNTIDIESYISRFYNNNTYQTYYNNFSFEISAEKFAIKTTYTLLSEQLSQINTEQIILDYVNAKIYNNDNEFQYPIQTNKQITTMNEIYNLLDKAYEKSLIEKKDFTKYINDYSGKKLQTDKELKMLYENTQTGKEQTHIIACDILCQNPNLCKIFHINKNDYDINTLKNIYKKLPLKEKETKELPEYKTNETPNKELEP